MRDESEPFSYQGRVFESREAMELFIASRAPIRLAGQPARHGGGFSVGKLVLLVVGALVGLNLLSALFFRPAAVPEAAPAPISAPVDVGDDLKEKAALVINLNGQLCARVTTITRLGGDVYSVSCVRYRDGTGFATYEMNAATGKVK